MSYLYLQKSCRTIGEQLIKATSGICIIVKKPQNEEEFEYE